MNLLDAILSAQGGGAVSNLSRKFNLSDDQTISAISSLLPALSSGLQRNLSAEGGLDSLLGALSSGRHQRYVEDPASLDDESTVQDGNGILGHILGSKDVSRQVAAQASEQTGVGADVLKRMLPLLATMVMGSLSQRAAAAPAQAQAGAGEGILGMLTPMLDGNRDGSIADDVVGMLGKLFR